MRTIGHGILWAVCVVLAACGRAPDAPAPAAPAAGPAAAAPVDRGNATEVHVDEGMLRDLRITTAAVESRQGDEQVHVLGELAVDERAYAEAGVPVAARVVRLLAGVGESVRAGQALLELQSPEVGRARAAYLSASAHLTLTEGTLARTRELAAERIAPQRAVQEAETDASQARTEVRAAAATLRAMGLDAPAADDAESPAFVLPAPIAGTVIERTALRGQMLDPGTPAFRIADLSTLWLTVHAFERDAVRIQPGARARVTFSAMPGETFDGTVSLIARQVSSESRTVDVRIDIRNPSGVLRPGMAATAALPIGVGGGAILTVPVAAVQRVGERWCVFVPRTMGVFEIRPIGRGRDLGGEVEVVSGLRAGETIVVDGAFLLKSQAEQADTGHEAH